MLKSNVNKNYLNRAHKNAKEEKNPPENITYFLGWKGDRHKVYSHLENLGPHRRILERSVHSDPPLYCPGSSININTENVVLF